MRLKPLDSLRGIAALVVVFHHSLLILPGGGEDRRALLASGFRAPMAWLYLTPLRLLVSGPAAVLLFFALSGLVLALSFLNHDGTRYLPFLVKRITRIWLPFVLVIVVAALLTRVIPLGRVPDTSWWFGTSWERPASMGATLQHVLMTGTAMDLDHQMWSLIHEMRVSMIFPVLVALTLWNWPMALVGSILCSLACVEMTGDRGFASAGSSIASTGIYVFLFIAGIAVAKQLRPMQRYIAGSRGSVTVVLWLVALGGLCLCPPRTDIVSKVDDDVLLILSGLSAALVVLLCAVEGHAFRMLLSPIPTYLGRISYSLYLLHVVVLIAVIHLMHGLLPVPLLILLGIMLSIVLADLSQRYVEVWTTKLGWLLARRLVEGKTQHPNSFGMS